MENQIIDVALGLALAFMIVSVLVSAVQEFLAGFLGTRSKQLEKGIKCLLFGDTDPKTEAEKNFITDLFKHPLLFNLSKGDRLPSYLPAENFAKAVVETSAKQLQGAGRAIKDVRDLVEAVNAGPCKELLAPLVMEASGDINRFRGQLETQYDHMMDRVSGWYKRHVQWYMLLYGFLIAALLNVDALQLTQRLWADPVARAAVVATVNALPSEAKSDAQKMEKAVANLDVSKLPIGWPTEWSGEKKSGDTTGKCWLLFLQSLLGWLITALAASLGAPFWFDAVGKLVRLKGAGAMPARSEDAQATKAKPTPASGSQVQEPIDNRNAIVDHYAERNQSDESYRPIQSGERW